MPAIQNGRLFISSQQDLFLISVCVFPVVIIHPLHGRNGTLLNLAEEHFTGNPAEGMKKPAGVPAGAGAA